MAMGFFQLEKATKSRVVLVIQVVFIMCWLSVLSGTDSLHSIYSLCGIVSVFCLCDNYLHNRLKPAGNMISCLFLSGLFSLCTVLANYPVFLQVRDPVHVSASTNLMQNILNAVCAFVGGTCVAFNVITALLARLPLAQKQKGARNHPGRVFLFVFLSIVLIDFVYLFLDEYPGHVTPDALDQILQGYHGAYLNNHPFWHTYWIKLVLTAGYALFGNPNTAVALFSILQILFVAACFAYALMTLYQAGMPKWCIGLVYVVYAFLPYNIAFSITMGKDVPFSMACLVLVVALYRILHSMDRKKWISYLMLGLSALLLCLSRTNGVLVLLMTGLASLPFLMKRSKIVLAIMTGVLILCLILNGPVLTALGVQETDFTEALSIPLQQLARVVYDECPLSEEDTAMLARIFDLEEIPELYVSWVSDPIKLEVRENDVDYFRENLGDYTKLWLRLGRQYPGEYFKAWVDQTKGYWNGGYNYHQYVEMMEDNPFGMAKTSGNNIVAKLIYLYFGLSRHAVFIEPLLSIGLHVWILALCAFVNRKKKRQEFLLSVPGLCIILGLLIGTPVYAEFRYAYAVFLTCPVILSVTVFARTQESSEIGQP